MSNSSPAQAARTALLADAARGRIRRTTVTLRDVSPPTPTPSPSDTPLHTINLQYQTDDSPQGWVPLRIIAPTDTPGPLPAVVFLHGTGSSKDAMTEPMVSYAAAGYLTAAIDCRYHGERAPPKGPDSKGGYQQAIVDAWRGSGERPFLLDNVWDLLHLLDLLQERPDVDASRVGLTGVSLGGMHTWLTAAADDRVAVAVPYIGVQSFRWAVDNNQFHGRVDSIPHVFRAATQDLGKAEVDAEVVEAVWKVITPGLLEQYDARHSLQCIAPRPLLIVNGELDPRCPVPGLKGAVDEARGAWEAAGAGDKVRLVAEPGVGHEMTAAMWKAGREWFDGHLLGRAAAGKQDEGREQQRTCV